MATFELVAPIDYRMTNEDLFVLSGLEGGKKVKIICLLIKTTKFLKTSLECSVNVFLFRRDTIFPFTALAIGLLKDFLLT